MDEKKYSKKDLYVCFILVAISFILLLGATIAWFAMNKRTDTTGMQIKMEVMPSLVLGASSGDITHETIWYKDGDTDFNDNRPYYLKPATHADMGYTGGEGTGLKYNTNPSAVSSSTGYTNGIALQFQPVPVYGPATAGRRYYVDYEAYISSESCAMNVSAFNARVGLLDTDGSDPDYFQAGSVDFYVDGTTQGAFVGTLNLAGKGKDADGNNIGDTLDLTGPTTIPFVESGEYIKVLMRFYFDGDLEESSGQAYVYSDNLSVEDFHIGVLFEAVEAGTAE